MKYFFVLLAMAITGAAFSQDFSYLDNIVLETSADFTPENNQNVIKAVNYLFSTPMDKKNGNRQFCFKYLTRYAVKTSAITITVESFWSPVFKDNEELLGMMMGVWLKTALINSSATKEEIEKKIFSEVYKYAKAGNKVKPTTSIKALIAAGDSDQISQWIEKAKGEK